MVKASLATAPNLAQPGHTERLRANTVIDGRYQIKESIGEGGMGVVFRAYDLVTKRSVALKTLRDGVNAEAVELFTKEWTALAGLSHPNIVDILNTGDFESGEKRLPYFVMPLLPGKTLEELIRSAGERLTADRVVEIVVQVCRGLAAAHERGLVHRDLKPSNIFVMDDDTAKVIDFGVVYLAGSHSVNGIKGTLEYMSPEQVELKPATVQSDIFALGVVTYEALTRRKPFSRNTEAAIAEAIRFHIPAAASELNPTVNEMVSRVVHKAMAKQPWRRFDTAREFADALAKAARNEPVEQFERSKIQPRIQRASKAFAEGDLQFAHEIVSELEAEGNLDPEMSVLRTRIDQANRHRTVRQLLESARVRCEEQEYPLALQKIQEVLAVDAENADALRLRAEIETRRGERQLEKWLTLLREHLHGGAFPDARKCIGEALKLSPNDPRVKKAQLELDRLEEQMSAARAQKDQLYLAAREAFRNGEISTALSKLERVLSLNRSAPDRAFPERDARYQQLYNQVRSEHDAQRMSFEEARRALAARDFPKALAICDEYLNRFPSQALFQALRLEVSELERQDLSAFIAETGRRVEAEPDLDRKLAILTGAAERYPREPHLQQSLKLVGDRRDLVASIVAKARQYEERRQYAEAIAQWQIVRSIYPQYPGLAFELEQLERRRDLQNRDDAKSRWIVEIEPLMESEDFEKALEAVGRALAEHPGDPELQALAKAATEGIEKKREAGRLLENGAALCARGDHANGLPALRRAAELDERNTAARHELAQALAAYARTLPQDRWAEAEGLVNEALELEPDHASARGLRNVIRESRRRDAVSRALAAARALQLKGEHQAALRKVDECLAAYPNEPRLAQLRALLVKAMQPPAPPDTENTETLVDKDSVKPVPGPAPVKIPAAPSRRPALRRLAALVALPLLAIPAVAWWAVRGGSRPHEINLAVNVPSAVVLIDGRPAEPPYRLSVGSHLMDVSAEGYLPLVREIEVGRETADLTVELEPELQRLRLITALAQGKVFLNGKELDALAGGALSKDDVPAGEHTIRIEDGRRPAIEFRFRSSPAELPEVLGPAAAPEAVLVGSLGNRVRVWAGAGPMLAGLRGRPLSSVPPEGLLIPEAQAGAELIVSNGKTARTIPLIAGNAPTMVVVAGDATPPAPLLTIVSNVEASVWIDNMLSKWQFRGGQLSRRLSPGKYRVKLSKDGYYDQEQIADLQKGDARLAFDLKPVPAVAALSIDGGTPFAEVWIDGVLKGSLDFQGAGVFAGVSPGDREINLRRPLFEDKSFGRRTFVAGDTVRISGADARMRAFGTLRIEIKPAEAEVKLRRLDATQYQTVKNGQSVDLREGQYRVNASAGGYEAREETFVAQSGRTVTAAMMLNPMRRVEPPAPPLFDETTWTQGGDGVRTATGPFGWLSRNQGTFDLDLVKKGGIEWVAGWSAGGKEKVVYRLSRDGSLRRQVTVQGQTAPDVKSPKRVSGDPVFRLRITIEPRRIIVVDRATGAIVDDYTHLGAELTAGRLGFQKGVRVITGPATSSETPPSPHR